MITNKTNPSLQGRNAGRLRQKHNKPIGTIPARTPSIEYGTQPDDYPIMHHDAHTHGSLGTLHCHRAWRGQRIQRYFRRRPPCSHGARRRWLWPPCLRARRSFAPPPRTIRCAHFLIPSLDAPVFGAAATARARTAGRPWGA